MTLRQLYQNSPLGCFGMLMLGGIFAAQFGMASVYGTLSGMNVAQISAFVAAFFVGAVVLQYPIGWISDHVDRRFLIMVVCIAGGLSAIMGAIFGASYPLLLGSAFLIGGMSNPLYSLFIAHTNDFLDNDDMAAASSGLVFINGLGAIAGPLIVGAVMEWIGPSGFFLFILSLFVILIAYSSYRMTQRPTVPVDETGSFVAMSPAATTSVGLEIAQEYAAEVELEEAGSETTP